MIVVELTFDGNPQRLELRPAHRERVTALLAEGVMVMAGPWADESGALLVFRAERRRVEEILAEDPYYHAPGVTIASIRDWQPIGGSS